MPTDSTDPTDTDLILTWNAALDALVALCEPLTPEQWAMQTPCPGWSVADVVAHTIDTEAFVGGLPRPEHTPDWDDLPHATGDFGRFTEVGVDARRGRAQDEVLAELRAIVALRRAQLDALEPGAEVPGLIGKPVPLSRMLRTRIFDIWVHEQDIRSAVGIDGGWNSRAAGVAFQQIVSALPYIWARNAKAPVGSTLLVAIIGPGLHHEVCVTVDEAGRGVAIPVQADPDVQMNIMWAALVQLACGRVGPDDPSLVDRVELRGDPALASALLAGMTITP